MWNNWKWHFERHCFCFSAKEERSSVCLTSLPFILSTAVFCHQDVFIIWNKHTWGITILVLYLVFDEDDYVIKEFYLANAPCLSYSLGSCVLVIAFDGELLLVSSHKLCRQMLPDVVPVPRIDVQSAIINSRFPVGQSTLTAFRRAMRWNWAYCQCKHKQRSGLRKKKIPSFFVFLKIKLARMEKKCTFAIWLQKQSTKWIIWPFFWKRVDFERKQSTKEE